MNVGESHAYLAELRNDLAAETDPGLRSWYEQESMLQPAYAEAQQTNQTLSRFAAGLQHLVELRTDQVDSQSVEDVIEAPTPEQPVILSPQELLNQKITKKYETSHERYTEALASIAAKPGKSSKREHRQRMATRQFAREITDFSDITGDEHAVLKVDRLYWINSTLIKDESLRNEVFASAADYAERHGKAVTDDHSNFANLILSATVEDSRTAANFDKILAKIFSTKYNTTDFPAIHRNLAHASFELLGEYDAIEKIVCIAFLREPYMTSTYMAQVNKQQLPALQANDAQQSIDFAQTNRIFQVLNDDIHGKHFQPDATTNQLLINEMNLMYAQIPEGQSARMQRITEACTHGDPVTVRSLHDHGTVDVGIHEQADDMRSLLNGSSLYRKRMQYLAPYSYAIKAAKQLTGDGVDGFLMPMSPGISLDFLIPQGGNGAKDLEQVRSLVNLRIKQHMPALLTAAAELEAGGVYSFEKTGKLGMVYLQITSNIKDGLIFIRPSVPTDRKAEVGLQILSLNNTAAVKLTEREGRTMPSNEAYSLENAVLRQRIEQNQKRFLGRRPVQFVMPSELRRTGLGAVSLRHDSQTGLVKATIHLNDGDVDLDLSRDLVIQLSDEINPITNKRYKAYYENIVLKHASVWMCQNEVETSEGVVSEANGNAANMGHFSYLRVLSGDRKAQFSEQQRQLCMEEQRKDLTAESVRLQSLDPTDQSRNSTYVRENYDPNKPPLIVYASSASV